MSEYLSDDEYADVQTALIKNLEAGAIIPGSGGIRKLRWGLAGRGKRSGMRIIYYAKVSEGVIWMLTLYAKSVSENIPAHILKQIKKEIDNG
ncbi:MAG: transcriptional regulator [Candidatus Methylomirabilis sp.]|nr:transcriptional regulator [Candidatus Methylomirabilis sp.]